MLRPLLVRSLIANGNRLAASRRLLSANATVAHGEHHEAEHNKYMDPGPPANMDQIPVPFKPYQEEHDLVQKKFNAILAGAAVVFALTVAWVCYEDTFAIDAWADPKSYRERKIYKPE